MLGTELNCLALKHSHVILVLYPHFIFCSIKDTSDTSQLPWDAELFFLSSFHSRPLAFIISFHVGLLRATATKTNTMQDCCCQQMRRL